MELNQLHFSHPVWLWGGVVIPLIWMISFFFYPLNRPLHHLEKFIDSHLLPYLLLNKSIKETALWKPLLFWSIVWSLLILALAGPRYNLREIETFSKDQSLVILLDLSESMNATDLKPSRLVRAKQKIEDLINLSKGVKIGLIAFAADPHMITPVTDDSETIRHFLLTLDTDLIHVQGSRLSPALEMASTLLESEPGNNKAILVISDGGFEDSQAIITAKKIAEKGIVIHAMGVGTVEGVPLKDHEGKVIKKNGVPLLSKLEKERFSQISKTGKGHYLEADYLDQGEKMILNELEQHANQQMAFGKKNQIWEEKFYLFILVTMPIILWWFRRGSVLIMILLFFFPTFNVQANTTDYFKNNEQLGKEALDQNDYEKAIHTFQDPYRKGVTYYKSGNFAKAEEMFRQSSRADVASNAAYNLGNALVQQQKLSDAVDVYENLLKQWPEHIKAKENLELVKKMQEQQKQKPHDDSKNSPQQDHKDQNQREPENKEKSDSQESQNTSEKMNERKKEEEKSSDGEDKNRQQNEEQADAKQKESNPQESKEDHRQVAERDQKEQKESKEASQKENQGTKVSKTQEDLDADLWLNKMTNDPKTFMKNKFYIESKKNGSKEGIDPW